MEKKKRSPVDEFLQIREFTFLRHAINAFGCNYSLFNAVEKHEREGEQRKYTIKTTFKLYSKLY